MYDCKAELMAVDGQGFGPGGPGVLASRQQRRRIRGFMTRKKHVRM